MNIAADLYWICFWVGFALSIVAFLAGPLHLHLPGLGALPGFLCWFGATGYLLARYYVTWSWPTLAICSLTAATGAALLFGCITQTLLRYGGELDRADYDMAGVIGTVSVPIRPGGTGEIVFSQAGVRRGSGARSIDGTLICEGTEVVVMQYELGIAYVRRWADLAAALSEKASASRDETASPEGGTNGNPD